MKVKPSAPASVSLAKPNPFPPSVSISYQRAETASKEREINCVPRAELRLLAAWHDGQSAFICIHFHSLLCRMDAQEPRKCQACIFVSPLPPAEDTPLIHSEVAGMKSHVLGDSGDGLILNYWVVPEAALAAGRKSRSHSSWQMVQFCFTRV